MSSFCRPVSYSCSKGVFSLHRVRSPHPAPPSPSSSVGPETPWTRESDSPPKTPFVQALCERGADMARRQKSSRRNTRERFRPIRGRTPCCRGERPARMWTQIVVRLRAHRDRGAGASMAQTARTCPSVADADRHVISLSDRSFPALHPRMSPRAHGSSSGGAGLRPSTTSFCRVPRGTVLQVQARGRYARRRQVAWQQPGLGGV